jgi:hypothetical protein
MAETIQVLEEIINRAKVDIGLTANRHNKRKYMEFLEWQLEIHPEYDLMYTDHGTGNKQVKTPYPIRGLLVDKLMLFSYMIGETPIVIDPEGSELRIGRRPDGAFRAVSVRDRDLTLLGPSQMGVYTKYKHNKTDTILSNLYLRNEARKKREHFRGVYQNWSALIDEIGSYSVVMEHFGQQISSAEHVRGHRLRGQ